MRNVFDQYVQTENRVTHALMTALNEDRILLKSFLKQMVGIKGTLPIARMQVLEQQYPGGVPISEEEATSRGIPDGWIYFDGEKETRWCVFIECKVQSSLSRNQVRRHRLTAESLGFDFIKAVAITRRSETEFDNDTLHLQWKQIYAWLQSNRDRSQWAVKAARYFEIAEVALIENEKLDEGTLTTFSGFPFSREYPLTYVEGKRVLGLAMDELRTNRDLRKLGVNSETGRKAIKGRKDDRVWDFLSLAPINEKSNPKAFTNFCHLTLDIARNQVEAMVTVPNAVGGAMRRNLKSLGEEGFNSLMGQILKNLQPLLRKESGARPQFRGIQRRYASQSAKPFVDAVIEFDLRTALQSKGPQKLQPWWLSAAYGAFVSKRGSNYQIQVGVAFPYEHCKLKSERAIELLVEAWAACEPLIRLSREGSVRK